MKPATLHCGGCDVDWDTEAYTVDVGERCPMCEWRFVEVAVEEEETE